MNRYALQSGLCAAFAFAILAVTPALAARPDTRAMTCAQAQAFVQSRGAVVMTTGRFTYERIVTNRSFCPRDETTWVKVAPTADNPQCRVGYYCKPPIEWRFMERFRN